MFLKFLLKLWEVCFKLFWGGRVNILFYFMLFPVALMVIMVVVATVTKICVKCKPSNGGCCGFLADGYPEADFNAEVGDEVNEDQNDDGCPANSIQNENYVRK